ncbi:hypothetical protein PYW08_007161 [Mythimna loreyi]|uniref:Uncharacterized protein n=1 Tax=Mythimna loreyi TaxID=667449 RepID=A0ACC2RBW5_9NEOP|nr:hypothetical protein PYW08_007161 [Mythimna loreyi]
MKTVTVVAILVTLCSGHVIPKDNSDNEKEDSLYTRIADDEGTPLQVNIAEPIDEVLLKTRSGANNRYMLYTRRNLHFPHDIIYGDVGSILASNYNPSQTLHVIVHGWEMTDLEAPLQARIRSTLLSHQDCNVIVVNWYELASGAHSTAAAAVPSVGEYLGDFLTWLVNLNIANWNQINLIGFGMGAHVVGHAGRLTGGRPARITGLDPAGPLFESNPIRLDRTNAQYVEVIHTDGLGLGILDPIGDADFYPNRGLHPHPGCIFNLCSHNRAVELFVETLMIFNRINGKECDDLSQALLGTCNGTEFPMGNGDVNKRGSGIYGLRVNRASGPF